MALYISRGSGQAFAERCSILRGKVANGMRPINIPQVFFIAPFETVTMGRYTVTALPANHDRAIECLNYIISDGSNTILWLHDTGIPLPRTWDYLKEHKLKFDLVSMDCSFPHGTNANAEHMDMKQCSEQVEILQHIGCMKETTLVFLSHIGHNVNATHVALEQEVAQYQMRIAYDGLQVSM